MPDQTAHDAATGALEDATCFASSVDHERLAAAVVAALGIPPDTTTSEISAGLWFLAHAGSVDVSQRQGGTWVARDRDRYSIRGVGASPAAAIHALAAKLAEAQR